MLIMSECLNCNKLLIGRTDKKFCDVYCKSSYHYEKTKSDTSNLYVKIDTQLKLNRRILKAFNKSGKSIVRVEVLISEGFNPNYFTHYWKNKKGDVYLFVYEFGFLKNTDNGKQKYVLVKHQDFMNS